MGNESKDQPVLDHIQKLVEERLTKIEIELDQCWDPLASAPCAA